MNKLGFNETIEGTVGISPSLFGSFYGEGGFAGLATLSFIYGLGLVYVVRLSKRLKPFAGVLVRAMICASLVPLLRGGDLPGIYAWIGLAFWPGLSTL